MGTATQNPGTIRQALDKASESEWYRLVSHQWDRSCWYVPSSTTPGAYYRLRIRPGTNPGAPWWDRLLCDCPAEASGKYRVCWHKAAVHLHWSWLSAEKARWRAEKGHPEGHRGYFGHQPAQAEGEWPHGQE